MDIGKDVLTKTIIGTTDAEKVFTPWWITLHHYLVYTLVVLGIIISKNYDIMRECSLSDNNYSNFEKIRNSFDFRAYSRSVEFHVKCKR